LKRLTLMVACAAALLLAVACIGRSEPSGKAVFTISGAAADLGSVSSLRLTIDSVRVHAPTGLWVTVTNLSQTFDLVELRDGGSPQLLAQADLDAGKYNMISLYISRAVVVDRSGEHNAYLPGNRLEISGVLDVKDKTSATANFDFLADQSLHLIGKDSYLLAPVVKLETRSNANVTVGPDNDVRVSGGVATTSVQVGMDLEGSVDVGLRISPDAVLVISSTGRIIQTAGHVLATGTLESVNMNDGTITLISRGGTKVVLHVAGDSTLKGSAGEVDLAYLADRPGSEVAAQYDAETGIVTKLFADADAAAKADMGSSIDIRGVVKAFDVVAGTVTVVTPSGTEQVLKVGSLVNPASGSVADVGAQLGLNVSTTLDTATGTAGELKADTEADVPASGNIKAVNLAEGSFTIIDKDGAEIALRIASDTKIMVNGSLAGLADLKSLIGAEVSLTYKQQSKFVGQINAAVQVKPLATVSGTLALVDVLQGFLTVTTDSGENVVLKAPTDAAGASASEIGAAFDFLTGSVGARVTAEYDAETGVIVGISIGG